MSKMRLKNTETNEIHISHFYHLVSAYVESEEMIKELEEMILTGIMAAKREVRAIEVSLDTMNHFFRCNPSGTVSLYARMGTYEIVRGD